MALTQSPERGQQRINTHEVIGAVLLIVGMLLSIAGGSRGSVAIGLFLMLVGLSWFVIARAWSWWYDG